MSTGDYIATSRQGYIQQIVSGWVRNGYYFYVQGKLRENKDSEQFDHKVITRYPVVMKAGRRFSRRQRGVINVAYLRYKKHWIMLATRGKHEETKEGFLDWRATEAANIRNCMHGQPIKVFGYSISYVRGDYVLKRIGNGATARDYQYRVRVQISREGMVVLKAFLLGNATSHSEEWLRDQFWNVPYEPYAPVRKQLLNLLRQVNAVRSAAGLSKLPSTV
ncbi:MAG: hypothetical protein AAGB04_20915, partial [Pseudomonadota bacterium]